MVSLYQMLRITKYDALLHPNKGKFDIFSSITSILRIQLKPIFAIDIRCYRPWFDHIYLKRVFPVQNRTNEHNHITIEFRIFELA